MSGELLTLGISHKTAPVALREKLALAEPEVEAFVQDLVRLDEVHEAVAISTCNRTELHLVVGDPMTAETELLGRLAKRTGIRPTELAGIVYVPRNCDAARHLFRVTSGLDSMIVGEAEVQGQVKRAYEAALAAGTTGPLTNRLFTAALQTGKRVRTETGLGSARTSVSTVAVDLVRDAVGGDLGEKHVVIIGAGETAELTVQALTTSGARDLYVANRRARRAIALAERFGGSPISLDALPEHLERADVVLSSTSSPVPIVGVEELELVMEARRSRGDARPLVLIDLAVPRDIEAACGSLDGVTLYDIDDLQAVVARNLSVREGERERATEVVEEEISRFARWLGELDVRPTIAALRERGAAIVDDVLEENAGRWETASPRDLARVEAMAKAVMQRLLHEPTIKLKAGQDHGRVQVARELFGLDEGTSAGDVAAAPEVGAADNVRALGERRR